MNSVSRITKVNSTEESALISLAALSSKPTANAIEDFSGYSKHFGSSKCLALRPSRYLIMTLAFFQWLALRVGQISVSEELSSSFFSLQIQTLIYPCLKDYHFPKTNGSSFCDHFLLRRFHHPDYFWWGPDLCAGNSQSLVECYSVCCQHSYSWSNYRI